MKIAVVGCGAMGSVYAGRLAAAGHEVIGVHRGAEHVAAMAADGLEVQGPDGTLRARLRAVRAAPAEPVDLVVIAVKAAHVGGAAAQAQPMIGPGTVVLTIQNGIGSADEVAAAVGGDRLAVGVAGGFGAELRRPGVVSHEAMRLVEIGPFGSGADLDLEPIAEAWRRAGFTIEIVPDIRAVQWAKLIRNAAYSAISALTGLPIGRVADHPQLGRVSRAAAREAWEVATALGVEHGVEDPEAYAEEFARLMPAARPSALVDLEHGRPTEIGVINGAVVRHGTELGVPVPVSTTLCALVAGRELHLDRTDA